jgi:hypothetical protein
MSAIDIIRSFAEAREEHDEAVINGGITYGVARELLAMHETAERIIAAQPEALAVFGAKMARLENRLRDTAQILISEVGADGPMDTEDAARKAVDVIARLK